MVVVVVLYKHPLAKEEYAGARLPSSILYLYTASKIFSSLTIRGKTKNFILFCWKVRGRDRTRQFLWFHIIVFVVVLYAVFFVLENSPFLTEKRSTTIILPHLTNGKRKQTQSFSPRKKNTIHNNMQWKSNVVVWLADFVNRFIWHNLKIMMQELTFHSFSIQFRQILLYISKNEKK